ncbi:penicillin acylase family protein [Paraburkholderia sp. BR14263]|uniref:penicillin acylase family protein n=1 Tax=unclassified Paraburkholderia TaxID=2615204 RepID=UPI0034CF22EF
MTRSSPFPPKRRRAWPLILLCAVVIVQAAMVLAGWLALRGSLPQLDGTRAVPLSAPVTIGRDALGVPTVQGGTRGDVAYASGFLHAQDRFFQMDLLRRVAAGEMAALIGPAALPLDRRDRPLRFREHAQAALAALSADQRELIERYTAGVNDGLRSLRARPFEYWLLRAQPAPWRPEDTVLAVYAMYFDLQYDQVRRVLSRAALRERVPADLLAFLLPETSHWDAPLDGQRPLAQPPAALPAAPPSWLPSTRSAVDAEPEANVLVAGLPGFVSGFAGGGSAVDSMVGSNGFAVDGAHSAHGGALLASDMHLGLSLPNIWYRISLVYPAPEGGERRITGVSLPGTPFVVAGSNGHIAWGFTNSYGRFVDLVELQRDPADPLRYRVPSGGWERAQVIHERLDVNGGASVDLPVVQTRWGPQIVAGERAYALHWVAQDPQATNMNFMRLEGITNVADALHAAQTFGMPTQNFMVADAQGHIGWTLAGPLPRFADANADAEVDGQAAALASMPYLSGTYAGWQGYRTPDAYPVRVDPPAGRIWTANNRTLPLEEVAQIGDAGTDLGARATQIRNDLLALPHAGERDMLAVQTDDRAFWIEYWRRVALDALDARALDGHPQRAEFQRLVQAWDGRAEVNAVGYRLVRAFYDSLYEAWFGVLDKQMAAIAPDLSYRAANSRYEATMETLADHRAWIPGGFADWRAFMLDRIDHTIARLPKGTTLEEARWGERNRSTIAHPFARMVPAWLPWVRGWLSAPHDPLPGDINMPRVQARAFGASERFAVSPGREQDGIFEMPGGQSGNPMSPYFLAGHETWVHGDAAPFLPGAVVHTLKLVPGSAQQAGN